MPKLARKADTFRDFADRDRDLRALTRFSTYRVMLYRTNLHTHSQRTAALVRAINPIAVSVYGAKYDPRKAELLALVHDDAELEFGDIQAGNKSKMTPEQLAKVREAEARAIVKIAKRFPQRVDNYAYRELLEEAADYPTLEAQVMCYADKYDALGEAMHEIFAGNHHFTTNVVNEYGRIPTPPEYYAGFFAKFKDKFPDTQPLFEVGSPIFDPIPKADCAALVAHGSVHTLASLQIPTGNSQYDTWRQIVLSDTNDEVVRDLYIQKEFLGQPVVTTD